MHEASVYKHYGHTDYWVKEQVPAATDGRADKPWRRRSVLVEIDAAGLATH